MQISPGRVALLAALGLAALVPTAFAPAAHAQTQYLFIINNPTPNQGTVTRFAGTGPGTVSTTGTNLSGGNPGTTLGLAFDTRGDLFASNPFANTVTEFPAGAAPGSLGTGTVFATGLNFPRGLASDANGDLFAATGGNTGTGPYTVTVFPSTGAGTFGPATTLSSATLNFEVGLAVDAGGDLFAANNNGGTITEFYSTGLGTFGPGTVVESGLTRPFGLAFDALGDLFATNTNNTITKFAAGAAPGTLGAATSFTDPTLNSPDGLAFDARGDLFASNIGGGLAGQGSITEFLATGVGTFGAGAVVETGLNNPSSLIFSPAVPEASTTVSLGLLLVLGMGGLVIAANRKKRRVGA